jgi:diguanylate cyclase (GGDEF)-like protein
MQPERRSGDPFAVSFRMGTLRTGVWPTMLVCAYCAVYFARTWQQSHRLALTAIITVAFTSALLIAVLPMERIVRGRWREPFFVSWSASLIALIAVATGLDGGIASPLAALFFLPLVYASLSYPFASMLLVGAMNLSAFLTLSALTPVPSGDHVFVFSGALISATVICAWQALNHARHRDELQRASVTDPLTSCLNRRGFETRLDAALAHAERQHRQVALVVFDLDDFKSVNDRHGHAAGDELLRWVGDVLRATLRPDDVIGRLGGDEFAAIVELGAAPPPGSVPIAFVDRVVAALGERTSMSAGVAVYPLDGATADMLHFVADARMYAHKRQGTAGDDIGHRPRPSQNFSPARD